MKLRMPNLSLHERAYNQECNFIIAIDGASASGKGTIAKHLAQKFEMKYYNSSIFYRRLAYLAYKNQIDPEDSLAVVEFAHHIDILEYVDGPELYKEEVTQYSSKIAAIPEIRQLLFKPQRDLVENNNRIVLDGRDIGTIIAPDAHLKLFVQADLAKRAERRLKQLQNNNQSCMFSEVFQNLSERDARDQTRPVAPLKTAEDAYIIDNSSSSVEAVIQKIVEIIENH